MKPYSERLPLIDAAIDALKGKWPDERFNDLILVDGVYKNYTSSACGVIEEICTRDEFEARAKEQPMKYKYGIEYKTNGEKPDLPRDVEVEVYSEPFKEWNKADRVGSWHWFAYSKFRIVDERYKPKEQDMNNDWYEKGERPPVGTQCEFKAISNCNSEDFASDWAFCKILYIGKNGGAVVESSYGIEYFIDELDYDLSFRPIPTETDKLVDEAMSLFSQTETTSDARQGIEHAVHKLIEQGYRKIKPMSEDEFVKCAEFRSLADLYQAGLRFIDNGGDK